MMVVYGILLFIFVPLVVGPFMVALLCGIGEVLMSRKGLWQALLLPLLTGVLAAVVCGKYDAARGLESILWLVARCHGTGAFLGSMAGLALGAIRDFVRRGLGVWVP